MYILFAFLIFTEVEANADLGWSHIYRNSSFSQCDTYIHFKEDLERKNVRKEQCLELCDSMDCAAFFVTKSATPFCKIYEHYKPHYTRWKDGNWLEVTHSYVRSPHKCYHDKDIVFEQSLAFIYCLLGLLFTIIFLFVSLKTGFTPRFTFRPLKKRSDEESESVCWSTAMSLCTPFVFGSLAVIFFVSKINLWFTYVNDDDDYWAIATFVSILLPNAWAVITMFMICDCKRSRWEDVVLLLVFFFGFGPVYMAFLPLFVKQDRESAQSWYMKASKMVSGDVPAAFLSFYTIRYRSSRQVMISSEWLQIAFTEWTDIHAMLILTVGSILSLGYGLNDFLAYDYYQTWYNALASMFILAADFTIRLIPLVYILICDGYYQLGGMNPKIPQKGYIVLTLFAEFPALLYRCIQGEEIDKRHVFFTPFSSVLLLKDVKRFQIELGIRTIVNFMMAMCTSFFACVESPVEVFFFELFLIFVSVAGSMYLKNILVKKNKLVEAPDDNKRIAGKGQLDELCDLGWRQMIA